MSDDEWSGRSELGPLQRSRDDLCEWEENRWSSVVVNFELPEQVPRDSSSTSPTSFSRSRSSSSLSSFFTPTLFTTQRHRFARPSLRPLRSCLRKSSMTGFTRLGREKRRVVFEFPDGHREQARPRSVVSSMSSAMDLMRKFLHLAFGYQSRMEWVGRVKSRRKSGLSRLSVDEFDAAYLDTAFVRNRRWTSSGSDTSPDLDDFPQRAYI
ncbi:hypothetical protein ACEPAF_9039 [Sanghuangporus sanghuang]